MHILVIDDDISVGPAILTLLRLHGWQAALAENGWIGVQAFKDSRFNMILVDIFMPVMDGFQTIKALRQLTSNVPIVAMSGFRFRGPNIPAPDFLEMAVELGAISFLRKPFGSKQLITACSASIDQDLPRSGGASP